MRKLRRITPAVAPYFVYRGGKARIRRNLVRWCPLTGSSYCEPFAGRANMFLLMRMVSRFQSWHLNDLQTIPFLTAVRDYDDRVLPEGLSKEDCKVMNPTTFLLMEPYLIWAGGLAGDPSKITGHRGHNMFKYRDNLRLAQQLLQGVCLTSLDALEVIEVYLDEPEAFLYIDPPYIGANVASYDDTMVDRKRMVTQLKRARCRWLLSEYLCDDLVRELGEPLAAIKNVPFSPDPRRKTTGYKTEYMWSNYTTVPGGLSAGPLPNIINFGYSSQPSHLAVAVFLSRGGVFDYNGWRAACPSSWSDELCQRHFDALANLPWTYFDGETLMDVRRKRGEVYVPT